MTPVLRITCTDLVSGESETTEISAGDYVLLTTEPCRRWPKTRPPRSPRLSPRSSTSSERRNQRHDLQHLAPRRRPQMPEQPPSTPLPPRPSAYDAVARVVTDHDTGAKP